jgi:hypothetical protein
MRPARYVWNDPARSLIVELALSVVERLSLEAMEAFKAVPRRGLEIGGLLLGSVTRSRDGQTRISIEDYADVPSEHRSGPSYQLSAADLETLDRASAERTDAVGMYRTATQSEALSLHEDDSALFERHFSSIPAVFLLIHPASRTAAFCLQTDNGLAVAHEFSFHAPDLAGGPVEAAAEVEPPQTATATTPPVGKSSSARLRLWAIRGAALVLGGLLGAVAWRGLEPQTRVAVPARSAAQAAYTPGHVALNVSRDGRMLRLAWDHNAVAVRQADHALLHIIDGNHQTNLNLSPGELNTGTPSYWADTPDVTFRLEVFGAGGNTDDTVRAVSATPSGTIVPESASTETEPPANQHRWAKVSARNKESEEAESDTASRSVPDSGKPSPLAQPARPVPAPMEAIAMPAPNPAATPPAATIPTHVVLPRVEVSAEPAPPSRWSRVVHHIPLLRRLKKEQQTVVPPEPVHESTPSLSAAERQKLTREVPIDVRVYLTESGAVDFAELVENRAAERHRELADAAVFAARRWNFRPARVGGENVPSEVILHFRFKPAESQP